MRVWMLFVLILAIVLVAAVLFPVLQRPRECAPSPEQRCASNLKQLALALFMYGQDYGECLPRTTTWMDAIRAYVKDEMPLVHCPADKAHRYSYAMNSQLSGRKLDEIPSPEQVILLFECDSARRNAAGSLATLADPKRHGGGLFFAFSDGRVQGVEASDIPRVVADSARALSGRWSTKPAPTPAVRVPAPRSREPRPEA